MKTLRSSQDGGRFIALFLCIQVHDFDIVRALEERRGIDLHVGGGNDDFFQLLAGMERAGPDGFQVCSKFDLRCIWLKGILRGERLSRPLAV